MNKIIKYFLLFIIGGILYVFLEILWRGYTHSSMFVVGGISFLIVGSLNESFEYNMSLPLQVLIGTSCITLIEFVSGIILNIWLKLNIWDYSNLKGNILGQICPQFILIWALLSLVCIILDDYLRYWFWNEPKPQYYFRSDKHDK